MNHHVVIEHEPHAHVVHVRPSRYGLAENGFVVMRLAVYDPPLDLEQTVAPPESPHVNAAKVKLIPRDVRVSCGCGRIHRFHARFLHTLTHG
jgi:hypothetical protein